MSDRYEIIRLRNQLCFPLYLVSKEMIRRYTPILEELDLTYTQYVVMMYLWEFEKCSVSEMGDALLLDPSTLTPLLKKLEGKEYITRSRDEKDGRVLNIKLTKKGSDLKEKALSVPEKMKCCIGLTPEEAAQLCELVMKILNNIEEEVK